MLHPHRHQVILKRGPRNVDDLFRTSAATGYQFTRLPVVNPNLVRYIAIDRTQLGAIPGKRGGNDSLLEISLNDIHRFGQRVCAPNDQFWIDPNFSTRKDEPVRMSRETSDVIGMTVQLFRGWIASHEGLGVPLPVVHDAKRSRRVHDITESGVEQVVSRVVSSITVRAFQND